MKHFILAFSLLLATSVNAVADTSRKILYVNSDVTTHILMPENLRLVDISTNDIVGNQCADNMIRVKPSELDSAGNPQIYLYNQFLGTVTMIGERHMVQYDLRYEPNPTRATSFYKVSYDDTYNYTNPDVAMPESEMVKLAWTVYDSKRRFHAIRENQYGIKAEVYNIFSIGDYFFIDFKLTNQTNIPYDIAELRVSLSDKKQTKSTNYQTVELTPLYVLNGANSFKKDYRQVIVLEKLTFPDDKILNIEVSENQISGRVITIPILYDDILHADGMNRDKIDKDLQIVKNTYTREKEYQDRETRMQKKNEKLMKKNLELEEELNKAHKKLQISQNDSSAKDSEPAGSPCSKKKPAKYVYVETTVDCLETEQ